MKNKLRRLQLPDGEWLYRTAPSYVTIWSPRDKKGSSGVQLTSGQLGPLNKAEGRTGDIWSPACVVSAIEVYILKTRVPDAFKLRKCQYCKKTKTGVIERCDPFDYEINGVTRYVKICEDCHDARATEI